MAEVVALVDDLMFLSRVREAARGRGMEVQAARTVPQLIVACRLNARLVFVDLDSPRLPVGDALAALKADADLSTLPVIGFFSHVHAERGRAARAAGCTRALPRSAFIEELPALLQAAGEDKPLA